MKWMFRRLNKKMTNMKKILHTIYTSLLLAGLVAFALTSCVDDELVKSGEVVEGLPVTVTLTLSGTPATDVTIDTRADNSLSDLNNLVIFVFHEDGTYEHYVSSRATDESYKVTFEKDLTVDDGVLYKVCFKTTTGKKKLIAVANTSQYAEDGGFWELTGIQGSVTSGELTFDQLKSTFINLRSKLYTDTEMQPIQISAVSQMMMAGWNTGIEFKADGTISIEGAVVPGKQVAVKMDRTMARITFNIKVAEEGATKVFVPSSYKVYNIPTQSFLTNTEKVALTNNDDKAGNYIHFASSNIGTANEGNYSFTFYMPENICNKGTGINDYQDRDKWRNGQQDSPTQPEKKQWTNAPQYSTFVVISGTYSQTATDKEPAYTGNVSYTIHLGNFNTEEGGSMDDFSVLRNYSYTYNVQVLGVDNIVAEVTSQENQPGAEGQIFTYDVTTYSYELDAHYEQVYLEYNLSAIAKAIESYPIGNGFLGPYDKTNGKPLDEDIDKAIADNLILIIQSEAMDYSNTETPKKPYSVQNKRGTLRPYKIYTDAVRKCTPEADVGEAAQKAKEDVLKGEGSGNKPTKGFDYKWIEFWPQSGAGLAKYPGVSEWSREDLTGFANSGAYGGNPTSESAYLKDVYDVIVAMGKVVKKIYKGGTIDMNDRAEDGITITYSNGNYVARFTAFVNEYYYYKHPLTEELISVWSVFTNKIPREMIIAMSSNTSKDGNSSFSTIYSYITQLSMQTFYNSRASNINGFGIETYNETPIIDNGFPFGKGIGGALDNILDDSDGRSNQIYLIGATSNGNLYTPAKDRSYGSWETYISSVNNGWTQSVTSDHTNHKLPTAFKYQYAASSCLSRNRDLNGNGTIDDNEVRWYLASLNEYIRMGIGAKAISNAAQLYSGQKSAMEWGDDYYPTKYISNGALYLTSSGSGKRLYWAVEKGAYGTNDYGNGIPLRCIRILPATISEGNANVQDISSLLDKEGKSIVATSTFEKFLATGNTPIVLKFKDHLVDALYRQRVDGSLDKHNEDDDANKFYEGIFVAKDWLKDKNNAKRTFSLGQLIGYNNERVNYTSYYTGTMLNPCADYEEGGYDSGWRVPNLVELSAMNAAELLEGGTGTGEASCTQFSNLNVRYGFVRTNVITSPGGYDNQIDGLYYVRCVRDVPAGHFDN